MAAERGIAQRRMRNQRLWGPGFGTAEDVVGWLVAMQAQEFPVAKWSVAQRARGVTDSAVDQAFADGTILRTHILRPTWHFVLPGDLRWLLALERAARARAERLVLPKGRARRRSPRHQRVGARPSAARPPPHPRRGRGRARTCGRDGHRPPARVHPHARRAGGGDLQRRAARQAADLRILRRTGAAGVASATGRRAGRVDRALLHQPGTRDGQGLRALVQLHPRRRESRPRDGPVAARARSGRRTDLLVCTVIRDRQGRRHRWSIWCRATTSASCRTARARTSCASPAAAGDPIVPFNHAVLLDGHVIGHWRHAAEGEIGHDRDEPLPAHSIAARPGR